MAKKKQTKITSQQRLKHARKWLKTGVSQKSIISKYKNHFHVDVETAIAELTKLGIHLPQEYIDTIRAQEQARIEKRKQKRQERIYEGIEQDENFAFIAGYTSGGAPFGVTWEEWEKIKNE